MSHPEVLRRALANMQVWEREQQMAQMRSAVSANRGAIMDMASAVVAGNADGDVTIVEFLDYNCGYCKNVAGNLDQAVSADGKVKVNLLKVVLVDLDPQGSASTWHAVRPAVPWDDGVEGIVLEVANLATLQRVLSKHKDAVVIIDTPPHNSSLTATVLDLVDMALVPVRPSAFDLAAVSDTADVIRRSKCGVVGAVLNGAIPQSTVGTEIGQALADAGLPVVGQMHQRMAFQYAAAAGLGVVEYAPRSKAAEEVNTLWDVIAAQLQVGEPV